MPRSRTPGAEPAEQPGRSPMVRTSPRTGASRTRLTGRAHGPYTGVIAGEFVVAAIMVAVNSVLSSVNSPAKSTTSDAIVNPSATVDGMIQFTAVCAVFFVLSLLASGRKAGRVAAAFGGLVVAGIAVNAAPTWQTLFLVFTGTQEGNPPKGLDFTPAPPPQGGH